MQIDPNINAGSVKKINPAAENKTKAKAPKDFVDFGHAQALEQSLRETPDVRPEMVQKAREVYGDPGYPPEEIVQRLSLLLASELDRSDENS
ncbi:MAG: hypothetical protein K9N48_01300 [Verrucomicrobia bacterium]|nr:hypothetical protein [Verrucomicrobiota bacterium]MCF7707288.1 hypothetical protein [Verrucomicrobiota bacterium]